MKAAGTSLRRVFFRRVRFLSLESLLSGGSLILYDSDVGGGRARRPLPVGRRRSQVFELALLPTSPERAAS